MEIHCLAFSTILLIIHAGNSPVVIDLRTLPLGSAAITISAEIAGILLSDTVTITRRLCLHGIFLIIKFKVNNIAIIQQQQQRQQ